MAFSSAVVVAVLVSVVVVVRDVVCDEVMDVVVVKDVVCDDVKVVDVVGDVVTVDVGVVTLQSAKPLGLSRYAASIELIILTTGLHSLIFIANTPSMHVKVLYSTSGPANALTASRMAAAVPAQVN